MSAHGSPRRTVCHPRKYKAACDQCHDSKTKCSGGSAPCERCVNTGQLCRFSLAARMGKPPGSRNRRTLDRLRQTGEEHRDSQGTIPGLSTNSPSQADDTFPSRDTSPHLSDLQRDCGRVSGSIEVGEGTDLNSLSPFFRSLDTVSDPQPFFSSVDTFSHQTTGLGCEGNEATMFGSVEPTFNEIEWPHRQSRWPDATDDNQNVGHHRHVQLSSAWTVDQC